MSISEHKSLSSRTACEPRFLSVAIQIEIGAQYVQRIISIVKNMKEDITEKAKAIDVHMESVTAKILQEHKESDWREVQDFFHSSYDRKKKVS